MRITRCTPDDLDDLVWIARKTFRETFAGQNTAKDMAAYLASAFSPEKLAAELRCPDTTAVLIIAERTAALVLARAGATTMTAALVRSLSQKMQRYGQLRVQKHRPSVLALTMAEATRTKWSSPRPRTSGC